MIANAAPANPVHLTARCPLLAVMAIVAACGDGVLRPEESAGIRPLAIVSNPVGARQAPTGPMASVLPAVYVSFRPGSFVSGISATIANPRAATVLRVALTDGGLDPVPTTAEAGDNLEFTIDLARGPPLRFVQVVPLAIQATVVRTEPPAGARDVPLNKRVRVVFSEPVDPTTVTDGTVRVERDGDPVPGRVTASDGGLEATYEPEQDLSPGREYTLVVDDGIRDTDGEPLDQPVSARFTTDPGPACLGCWDY